MMLKFLRGRFCRVAHRDLYLESLNRLGLARLMEAQAQIAKSASSADWAMPHPESLHADLLVVQGRIGEISPAESRALMLLKPAKSHSIYDFATCKPELVTD